MNSEERLLIERAQHGEHKAFGALYDAYLSRIYRFVLLRVGRRPDAEDITHQVFLSAWQSIERYEYRGVPFSSWLYRIASNAVIDHYRTRRSHLSLDVVAEEAVADLTDGSRTLDDAREVEFLKTILTKLDPDQQSVLIMKFVDDLSTKEIAEALEKSPGAIRVIQHRALRQLKKHVDALRPHPTTETA